MKRNITRFFAVFIVLSLTSGMVEKSSAASFQCTEYRKRLSHQSAKEASKGVPSWAKGKKPCKKPVFENGTAFAKRLMDERYSGKEYDTSPGTEYSKIHKFGDRAFE